MLIFLYRIRDKNITVKEKRIDVYKMPFKKLISKRWLAVFFRSALRTDVWSIVSVEIL